MDIDFGEVMSKSLINLNSKRFFDSYYSISVYYNLMKNIGKKELLSRKYPKAYSLYKQIVHR